MFPDFSDVLKLFYMFILNFSLSAPSASAMGALKVYERNKYFSTLQNNLLPANLIKVSFVAILAMMGPPCRQSIPKFWGKV